MLKSVRPFALSIHRQHSDSIALWISVLAGSLLLNGFAAVGFQALVQRVELERTEFEAISVDFLDFTTPSEAALSGSIAATVPPSAKQRSTLPQTTVTPPSIASQSATPEAAASYPSSPQSDSTAKSPAAKPTLQPQSSGSPPQPEAIAANSPQPNLASPSLPSNSRSSDANPLATTGDRLPGLPSVPNPAQIALGSDSQSVSVPDTLPNTLIVSRNPIPSEFLVQVKILPSSTLPRRYHDGRAIGTSPDPAAATLNSKERKRVSYQETGCLLTPEALRGFDQPVTLQISLAPSGQLVDAPITIRSGVNDSYNALAICALKTWRFTPTLTLANRSPHNVSSTTEVQVTLSKP